METERKEPLDIIGHRLEIGDTVVVKARHGADLVLSTVRSIGKTQITTLAISGQRSPVSRAHFQNVVKVERK